MPRYREKNREWAAQFRTTRSYGEDWKLLLDEEHRWFTVTRARDLADANPDMRIPVMAAVSGRKASR